MKIHCPACKAPVVGEYPIVLDSTIRIGLDGRVYNIILFCGLGRFFLAIILNDYETTNLLIVYSSYYACVLIKRWMKGQF